MDFYSRGQLTLTMNFIIFCTHTFVSCLRPPWGEMWGKNAINKKKTSSILNKRLQVSLWPAKTFQRQQGLQKARPTSQMVQGGLNLAHSRFTSNKFTYGEDWLNNIFLKDHQIHATGNSIDLSWGTTGCSSPLELKSYTMYGGSGVFFSGKSFTCRYDFTTWLYLVAEELAQACSGCRTGVYHRLLAAQYIKSFCCVVFIMWVNHQSADFQETLAIVFVVVGWPIFKPVKGHYELNTRLQRKRS